MKIKRLELTGFKSFVDKTIIDVPPGITGIVGPNGCGKSNIVDAIRWVLGEQSSKNLRGKSMEDVIFNGSENRVPIGMAEVNVTFDNMGGRIGGVYSSHEEISVGRRLFRSGESEYLINRQPVRLRDVQEIFMDTGVGPRAHYSIIEQGKIGLVLSAKSEDRRILIEEAAGISKFRVRKEAALRRIESTEQNMLRISDVVGEVKRQLEYTRRQAQKAQKHVELKNEILSLEAQLWKVEYREEEGRFKNLSQRQHTLAGEEDALKIAVTHIETDLERKRLESLEAEKEIQGVQENLFGCQARVQLLEKDLVHAQKGLQSLAEQQTKEVAAFERAQAELKLCREQLLKISDEREKANAKESRVSEELANLERELARDQEVLAEKIHATEELRRRLSALATRMTNAETRLEHAGERREEMNTDLAQRKAEEEALEKSLRSLQQTLKKSEEGMASAQQMQLELKSKAEAGHVSYLDLDLKRLQAEEKLQATRQTLTTLKSRLSVLKELRDNYEGLKEGVRSIMLHKKSSEGAHLGILGLVGELVSLPKEYERAAEAALGERLQYVVVRSQEEGIEAVRYLNDQSRGRSTFVPLDLRPSSPTRVEEAGTLGALRQFVKAEADYTAIVDYLFGDIYLVKALEDALRLSRNGLKKTLVTLQGEVVDAFGIVSGGRADAQISGKDEALSAGLLQRQRIIQDLEVEISRLSNHLAQDERQLVELAEKLKSSKWDLENLQKGTHEKELKLVEQQKELQQQREECRRHEQDLQALLTERRGREELLQNLIDEEGQTRRDYEEALIEQKTVEAQVTDSRQSESDLRVVLEAQKRKVTDLQISLAEAREQASFRNQELHRLENNSLELATRVEQLRLEMTGAREKEDALNEAIRIAEKEISEKVNESFEIEGILKGLRENYQRTQQEMSTQDKTLRDDRHRLDKLAHDLAQARVDATEAKMRLERLEARIQETQKIDVKTLIEEALAEAETGGDENTAAARLRLDELRVQISGIGEVNLAAIAELEELSKRLVFLNRQKEDLERSIESLHKTIARVNRTSRELFRTTFDAVNAKFQTVFPRLFGGGKASLILTDEQNLLETGIDILCQPPGKKIQNVTLLSGGEKALASICLILAIFLIKPSPFCLLDEVDAPLDDANISRFNELLHELANESQLLLITHNRHTMEIADHLYGVTMEEPGVSRMVSVKMH